MKIFKYRVGVEPLSIPRNFTVLKAGYQNDYLCLWCLVDPTEDPVLVQVDQIGTGWEIDGYPGIYVETVFDDDLVWHVYINLVD